MKPRLWLKPEWSKEPAEWLILDGKKRIRTRLPRGDKTRATLLLDAYRSGDRPPRPKSKSVSREPTYDFLYARLDLARRRSAARGRSFDLTVADLRRIGRGQRWKCALTGLPFGMEGDSWCRPYALAIDRIDNKHGYTPSNVRLVLHAINVAIGPWGDVAFEAIARAFLRTRSKRGRYQRVKAVQVASKLERTECDRIYANGTGGRDLSIA